MSPIEALSHVDPDLRQALASMPELVALSDDSLPGVRAALEGLPAKLGTDEQGVRVRRIEIPVAGAPLLSALLYEPPSGAPGPHAALLNFHGGGFVAGTAQREDATMRKTCAALGCVAVVPDYRLAPEHPYPAALDDAHAALNWLAAQSKALNVDPARLALRGVSAGGGLATGLALRHRDEGGAPLRGLQLLYPMLDDRTGEHPVCGREIWTPSANRFGWDSLLRGQNRDDPPAYAAVARAITVAGLPPSFLAVGSIDLFATENLVFAQRLIDAGVPLEMHVYPGAFHGFTLLAHARCAQALARDGLAWLDRVMNEEPWA